MSMNLLYEAYPESVNLYGVEREIVTDFKDWLRFIDMIRCDGKHTTLAMGGCP